MLYLKQSMTRCCSKLLWSYDALENTSKIVYKCHDSLHCNIINAARCRKKNLYSILTIKETQNFWNFDLELVHEFIELLYSLAMDFNYGWRSIVDAFHMATEWKIKKPSGWVRTFGLKDLGRKLQPPWAPMISISTSAKLTFKKNNC